MRKEIKFNNDWRFLEQKVTVDNFAKTGAHLKMAHAGYMDDGWTKVTLPHDWMTSAPISKEYPVMGGGRKCSRAVYRKEFFIPDELFGKHLSILFEGVSKTCEVYFNGSLIKRCYSAYEDFSIDITDRAIYGENNAIVVLVDGTHVDGWW